MQCVRVTKNRFGSVQIHCRVVVGECNDRDGVWVRGNCGNGFGGRELRRKLGSFGDFVVGDSGAVWVAGVLSGRGDSGAGLGSWLAVIRPLGISVCGENWVRSVILLWGIPGRSWVVGELSGRDDSGAGLGSWLAVVRPLGTGICGENWVRSVILLWRNPGRWWVVGKLSGRDDSGAGLGSWLAAIRPLGTGICGENWVRSVNLLWSGAKRRRDGVGPRKVRFGTEMVKVEPGCGANTYGSTAGPRVVQ